MGRGESRGRGATDRTVKAALRQVLGALPLLGLMLDSRGRVAYANPRLLELTGWSRRDLQGRSWFRKISGSREEAKSDASVFQRMRDAEGGTERNLQHLVTRSGERRSVLWDHLLLGGDRGGSPFCACIGEDVTDKFRVVDRLCQSERRAQRLVDSLPLGVHLYHLDGEGHLIFQGANAAADRILGIPHADLIGKEILEAFPSLLNTETPLRYEDLCRAGGEWHREEVAYEGDRIRSAREVVAFQSEPGSVAVLFRDITQERRSHEELHIRDRAIAKSLSAIAFADGYGRLTYANQTFLNMWEYRADEVLGRRFEEFWEEPQRALRVIGEISAGSQHRGELLAKRRDGSRFPAEVFASSVVDGETGRVLCLMGFFADITERKRFEEMLSSAVRGVSGETGERFFHAMVESLRKALQADCVFVGRLAPEAPDRIRTMAVFTASGEAPNFEYPLAGSPCETVVGHRPRAYPTGVAERFPEYFALREMGVGGYAGIPLWDERGMPLGVLVALFGTPLRDPEGTLSILQLFGSRAAAEMRRKETTDALVESRRRYESLVNSLDGAVYEVDIPTQTITYMSPQVEALVGYPPEAWLGNLSFWAGLVHEEDRDRIVKGSARTMAGAKPQVFEYRMRRKDGRVIWVRDSVRFLPEGGPPRIMRGLSLDITREKEAELALRVSEERYRLLADNIHDVIWTIDVASRKITYASPSIEVLRGITVEEALAEPIDVKLPDGGMEFVRIHLEDRIRRFAGGDESLRTVTHVVRQKHRDGRWLDVEMVTTLLTDERGRVTEILGVSRDISARVRAEQENRKLAVAVEQMADGILIVGGDGRIAYANPAFRGITGLREERILGEQASVLAARREGEGPILEDLLNATRQAQSRQGRFWFSRAEGGEFLADARVFPIRDPGGTVTQFVAFVRDVTEEVALHEKLRKAQELERLGRLVGGVAHEVRNPLNAILASTDALAMDLGDDPEYQPLFEVIRSQLNRMSHLMRELLELGKPIPPEHLGRCSLREVCQEAASVLHQSHSRDTRGRVRLEISEGDAPVRGDRNKLVQVLVNLLDNAIQCDASGAPIRLIMEEGGDSHRLRVEDAGPGIPEAHLGRVFEPFFSTRKGGTGLGLTLVKHLVEQHGGQVCLLNRGDRPGCTAEIILPAWESQIAGGGPG